MSAFEESVSVLDAGRAGRESTRADRRAEPARGLITLVAFAVLGLYGVSRWSILLDPRPTSRMLGLLALATATAGGLEVAVTPRPRCPGPGGDPRRARRPGGAGAGRHSRHADRARAPARDLDRGLRWARRAAARPRALQRRRPVGAGGGDAGRGGAADGRRIGARLRAPIAGRRPPRRGGDAAHRARGRTHNADPTPGAVSAGPAAARPGGGAGVGRAAPPARRAGGGDRPRAGRSRCDGDRAGARSPPAAAQLRGSGRCVRAHQHRHVRLVPALRPARLAAHRARGDDGEGRTSGLLEGTEPRYVRRRRLGPGVERDDRRDPAA